MTKYLNTEDSLLPGMIVTDFKDFKNYIINMLMQVNTTE